MADDVESQRQNEPTANLAVLGSSKKNNPEAKFYEPDMAQTAGRIRMVARP